MGGRGKDKSGLDAPGPGNYDPDIGAQKPRAPGAKMGTGGRAGLKGVDGPAPGDYNVDQKGKGGITMGARLKGKDGDNMPGPGAYSGDVNKVKGRAPGTKFGSPSKKSKLAADTPGPGNYDQPGFINPSAKKGGFSFGKEAP